MATITAQVWVVRLPSGSVQVTNSGFNSNVNLQLYTGTITIRNTGSQPIGPTILVSLHGLDPSIVPDYVDLVDNASSSSETGPNGDYMVSLPDGVLAPGQSITQNVRFSDPFTVAINFTSQVFQVLAGGACDISQNGPNVVDAQLLINQALGNIPAVNDLNTDGVVNVVDVQLVTNAVLGLGCFGS